MILGFDCSTQRLKVVCVEQKTLTVVHTASVHFDSELHQYHTEHGVLAAQHVGEALSPSMMFVEALDMLLDKMQCQWQGFQFADVVAVSGSGQQHGCIYWRHGAMQALLELNESNSLRDVKTKDGQSMFAVDAGHVWMDSSTSHQCRNFEQLAYAMRFIDTSAPHEEEEKEEELEEQKQRMTKTGNEAAAYVSSISGSRAYERFAASQLAKLLQTPEGRASMDNCERISLVSSLLPSLFTCSYAPIDQGDASGMNLLDVRRAEWHPVLTAACVAASRAVVLVEVAAYIDVNNGLPRLYVGITVAMPSQQSHLLAESVMSSVRETLSQRGLEMVSIARDEDLCRAFAASHDAFQTHGLAAFVQLHGPDDVEAGPNGDNGATLLDTLRTCVSQLTVLDWKAVLPADVCVYEGNAVLVVLTAQSEANLAGVLREMQHAADGIGMTLVDFLAMQAPFLLHHDETKAFMYQQQSDVRLAATQLAMDLTTRLGDVVPCWTVVGNMHDWYQSRFGFSKDCKVIAFSGDNLCTLAATQWNEQDCIVSLGTSDVLFAYLSEDSVLEKKKGSVGVEDVMLEGHIFRHSVAKNGLVSLLCFKNGSLTRENVMRSVAAQDWHSFNLMVKSRPAGNQGFIGFFFHECEILPRGAPIGTFRFDGKDEPCVSPSQFQKGNDSEVLCWTGDLEIDRAIECRAVVESHAMRLFCATQDIYGDSKRSDVPVSRVVISGGASGNPVVVQVIADVFQVPVFATQEEHGFEAAYGSALRAVHACAQTPQQEFVSLLNSHPAMQSVAERLTCVATPNKQTKTIYADLIHRYRALQTRVVSA